LSYAIGSIVDHLKETSYLGSMYFIRPDTNLVPLYLDSVGKSLVHHFAHMMLLKVINSHYLNVIHLLNLGHALWSVLVVLLALCLLRVA
jgi:hypothetical protein